MSISGISTSVPALLAGHRPDSLPRLGGADGLSSLATDPTGPSFSERMGEAFQSVNAQQLRASDAVRDFEAGRSEDLVAVMVEQQVSSLGFEMTKQIRNRALSAYRDIMNMPV